mmetsp:Transcript_54460/g.100696  ORF Transcript_54460/g.100696 Transcript_54460/m.100696 type:complete len:109 (-) Transcript_54460:323-649(-)
MRVKTSIALPRRTTPVDSRRCQLMTCYATAPQRAPLWRLRAMLVATAATHPSQGQPARIMELTITMAVMADTIIIITITTMASSRAERTRMRSLTTWKPNIMIFMSLS